MANAIIYRAALIAAAALAVASSGTAASTWSIRPYCDFVHFVSIGNFDRALESFSEDATVVIDEVCPADDPCVGKAAIAARYLSALRRGDLPLPLVNQRFDGRWMHTRGDAAMHGALGGNTVRRHGSHRLDASRRPHPMARIPLEPHIGSIRSGDDRDTNRRFG
jgi:hypothetical protein